MEKELDCMLLEEVVFKKGLNCTYEDSDYKDSRQYKDIEPLKDDVMNLIKYTVGLTLDFSEIQGYIISVKIMKSNAIFMYIKTMFDQLMNDKSMNHILFKKRETKTYVSYVMVRIDNLKPQEPKPVIEFHYEGERGMLQ